MGEAETKEKDQPRDAGLDDLKDTRFSPEPPETT